MGNSCQEHQVSPYLWLSALPSSTRSSSWVCSRRRDIHTITPRHLLGYCWAVSRGRGVHLKEQFWGRPEAENLTSGFRLQTGYGNHTFDFAFFPPVIAIEKEKVNINDSIHSKEICRMKHGFYLWWWKHDTRMAQRSDQRLNSSTSKANSAQIQDFPGR